MTERDHQAVAIWQVMPQMTDQQIRDAVKLFPEYFEMKEEVVDFNYDAWVKAIEE